MDFKILDLIPTYFEAILNIAKTYGYDFISFSAGDRQLINKPIM